MKTTRFVIALMSLPAIAFLTGCGRFSYLVDFVNFGHSGVMIRMIGDRAPSGPHPAFVDLGVTVPMIIGRFPTIPSKYRNPPDGYGVFEGHKRDLPNQITIEWQLADLTNCKEAIEKKFDSLPEPERSASIKYSRTSFFYMSDCRWKPREDKIFRKTLDFTTIKQSEAYKKTGKSYPDVAGSRYTLGLTVVIIEDQIFVEAANGATNPWL